MNEDATGGQGLCVVLGNQDYAFGFRHAVFVDRASAIGSYLCTYASWQGKHIEHIGNSETCSQERTKKKQLTDGPRIMIANS